MQRICEIASADIQEVHSILVPISETSTTSQSKKGNKDEALPWLVLSHSDIHQGEALIYLILLLGSRRPHLGEGEMRPHFFVL